MWIYSANLDASYLPICKGGCTSITAAMLLHEGVLSDMPEDHAQVHRMLWYPMGDHNAILFRGLACRVARDDAPPPGHVFTFVRNPLARLVSCYRDKVCSDAFWLAQDVLRVKPFGEFVRRVCDQEPATLDLHVRPQSVILKDITPEFVGKVEFFTADWARVGIELGWPKISLPHLNETSGSDWRDEYGPDTLRIAHDYYQADMERFGYAV